MPTVFLLGPQQVRRPNLGRALRSLHAEGAVAAVTAGWQEREGEAADLERHLAREVVDLRLYRRAEEVFARDPAFAAAYHERQGRLQELQRLYRLRLAPMLAAARAVQAADGPADLVARARRDALQAVRVVDRQHRTATRRLHRAFDARWRPLERPVLSAQRAAIASLLEPCPVLLIAGGHVVILINRLRLFGVDRLLAGRAVLGWSAGAMALCEKIVLYHDRPPQGAGDPELLEEGLGLVPGVVALPQARQRLALDQAERVALFAARFAPAACLTLDDGALLEIADGRWRRAEHVHRLDADGGLQEVRLCQA